MSDAMIEMAPGSRDGDDRRFAWWQEWEKVSGGISYETWLEGKLLRAEDERDEHRRRQREDEDQLVRIANYFGKDARQAPEHDQTIAGMVIAEVDRLRRVVVSMAELVPFIGTERFAMAAALRCQEASRVLLGETEGAK